MKIGNIRKSRLTEFTIKQYGINGVLLGILFLLGSVLFFILYSGVFGGFFYILLYHTGCPNCTNAQCPFNPDFGC